MKIKTYDAGRFVKKNYFSYGVEVNEDRAIPAVLDGLKPVVRRSLWAANKMGLHNNKTNVKTARLVGDIIGKYHPHGDSSVEAALATQISSCVPTFEGEGNWGNFSDKKWAAQRYCVTGDTLIKTNFGDIKISKLPKLFGQSKNVLTKNGFKFNTKGLSTVGINGKQVEISTWINSGKHNVLEIKTNFNSLKCTPNHPILTLNSDFKHEWVESGKLAIGDYLCVTRSQVNNNLKHVKTLTESNAKFLGYLVSEGYRYGRNGVGFSNTDDSISNDFRDCLANLIEQFDLDINVIEKTRIIVEGNKPVTEFNIHSAELMSWLKSLGFKLGSKNQRVPKVIFKSSNYIVSNFLSAYYSGDGSISCGAQIDCLCQITADSISKKLLKDISYLLWSRFSILTGDLVKDSRSNCYKLYVLGNESNRDFIQKVNFTCTIKKDRCTESLELLNNIALTAGNSKTDIIPFADRLDNGIHKTRRAFRRNYLEYSTNAKQLAKEIYDSDYLYVKIESIKSLGKEWVYDLTVPETHSFTANNFVVHNTNIKLSKYSDLVFFDNFYLPAIDLIDNFDGEEKEPVVLPALLPHLLLNGASGIGVGMATEIPQFTLSSVLKTVKQIFTLKDVNYSTCKNLELNHVEKAIYDKKLNKEQLKQLIDSGKGRILFEPVLTLKPSMIEGTGFVQNNLSQVIDKVEKNRNVVRTFDAISTESRYGKLYIYLKKCLNKQALDLELDKVKKDLSAYCSYNIKVVKRFFSRKSNTVEKSLADYSVIDILKDWYDYRIDLEKRACGIAIEKVEKQISDLELKIKAVDHLDDIVACLKSKMDDKQMTEKLSKVMKVSLDDAFKVICFEVRRLKSLEKSELIKKIKEHKSEIKAYQVRIKNPDEYILTTLKNFEKLV